MKKRHLIVYQLPHSSQNLQQRQHHHANIYTFIQSEYFLLYLPCDCLTNHNYEVVKRKRKYTFRNQWLQHVWTNYSVIHTERIVTSSMCAMSAVTQQQSLCAMVRRLLNVKWIWLPNWVEHPWANKENYTLHFTNLLWLNAAWLKGIVIRKLLLLHICDVPQQNQQQVARTETVKKNINMYHPQGNLFLFCQVC